MRAILGLLGLLIALTVTGVLVRQQMTAQPALPGLPAVQQTDEVGSGGTEVAPGPASGTPTQQSQQMQQQYKQALDNALQTRPLPNDQP
jgi:hypothetical protein